jgi:AraC-like DNA-binding protein
MPDAEATRMRATEFVESYIEAWNHRDPQAIADHLTDDGTYVDIPENVQRSHDELIVTLKDFFSTHRHRYELIGEILKGQETVAFQYRMLPPGKTASADIIHGAEFVTFRGDAALNITDYYDSPDIERSTELARATSANGKYAKSGLNEQQMSRYKNRLSEIMRSEQIFLQPDVTLPKLAHFVGCSVNHLSQVINAGFGMSFFDYLNHFRIEHAKQLLADTDGKNGAVLNVAFSVGFNSNSAFYAAFKKCVGQTPAQYRRRKLRNSH